MPDEPTNPDRPHVPDYQPIVDGVLEGIKNLLEQFGIEGFRTTIPFPSIHKPRTGFVFPGGDLVVTVGTNVTAVRHFVKLYRIADLNNAIDSRMVTMWDGNKEAQVGFRVAVPPPLFPEEYVVECFAESLPDNKHRIVVKAKFP